MQFRAQRWNFWLGAGIVALTALVLYAPTWHFDFVYLDDVNLILNQQRMLSRTSSLYAVFGRTYFPGPFNAYYRPLVNLSIVMNYHLAGAQPFGYHLTNSLLHAIDCVLVYALLHSLGLRRGAALLAALIFVVHPVQVASVVWIPGRNDLLVSGFALGACLFLMTNAKQPSLGYKLGHLTCFAAALFCKETALCLPLIFLAALLAVQRAPAPRSHRWLWAGWVMLIGSYFALRAMIVPSVPGALAERLRTTLGQVSLLLSDAGKLFMPTHLQVLAAPEDVRVMPGVVAILGVTGLLVILRGIRRGPLILAITLMAAPLLVSLPAAKTVMLENRLYLPLVGAAVLVGEVLSRPLAKRRLGIILSSTLAGCSIVLLGFSTLRYSRSFRDRDAFSQAALEASPHSSIAMHLRYKSFYPQQLDALTNDP